MSEVVTELTVDARGVSLGLAESAQASKIAQAALDRFLDRLSVAREIADQGGASLMRQSTSIQRAARDWESLKKSLDDNYRSTSMLEADMIKLDRAVTRLGVSQAEAAQWLDKLVLKHDAAARAARDHAAAEEAVIAQARQQQGEDNARMIAAANQANYNRILDVRDPRSMDGNARGVSSAFNAEFERLDDIARLKAQQVADNFSADLHTRLVAGTGKAARDSVAVFQAEFERLDNIANLRALQVGANFTSDLNARLGIGGPVPSARGSASLFLEMDREAEAYQKRLATVRADIDPLTAAIERQQGELAELAVMYQRGDLSAQQFAQGQAVVAQRVDQVRAHLMHVARAREAGGNIMAGINSAQQFQDILITSMMGQGIGTIALQQGTQLGSAAMMTGAGGPVGLANALRSSLAALANPLMLGAVGFTAITAASIQFFTRSNREAKTLNDLLKEQENIIDSLGPAYEDMKRRSGSMFIPDESEGVANVRLKQNAEKAVGVYQTELAKGMRGIRVESSGAGWSILNSVFDLEGSEFGRSMLRMGGISSRFSPFADIIESLESGRTNIIDARREIEAIGRANPDLAKTADAFIKMTSGAADAYRKLMELRGEISRGQLVGPGAMGRAAELFDPQMALRRRMYPDDFEERNTAAEAVELQRIRDEMSAARLQMTARSPDEMGAAARAVAEAASSSGESPEARRLRIELAGTLALETAQNELRKSQEQRTRALDQTLAQQKLEIDLVGKTAGEQARLRFEYERTQEVKEEAFRNGIPADEKELELIRQKTVEMGRLADAAARSNLADGLMFRVSQAGRSALDREVAASLRSAGLDIDLHSPTADAIRYAIEVEKIADAWSDVRDVGMDAIDSITDSALQGFENIEDVLRDVTGDLAKELAKLSISNPFKNAIYGESLPTLDSLGGLRGFWSAITGGKSPGAAAAGIPDIVGAMTVNAASVVVTGAIGVSGSAGDAGGLIGNVTRLLTGANGNGGGAPAGYGEDLASNITTLANNIGAKARDVAALMSFESGLRPDIWGGAGGRHFGLIQAGPNERSAYGITPGGSLADQFGGIERYFLDRGFKPGMGMMDLYSTVNAGRPGRYGASDAANGGTWGTVADKVNYQMGAHFERADKLLSNFADSTRDATGGLDKFGSNLANALTQFPAAPSAPGGGGFLSRLFGGVGGGLSSAFAGSKAFNWLSANPGGYIGLYANGTEGAPPGWAWVGEEGPELMRLRGGETIRSNPRSTQMAAAAARPVINVQHVVHNSAGAEVRTEQTEDSEGNIRMETFIDRQVASAINKRGSATEQSLRARGINAPRPRR